MLLGCADDAGFTVDLKEAFMFRAPDSRMQKPRNP